MCSLHPRNTSHTNTNSLYGVRTHIHCSRAGKPVFISANKVDRHQRVRTITVIIAAQAKAWLEFMLAACLMVAGMDVGVAEEKVKHAALVRDDPSGVATIAKINCF